MLDKTREMINQQKVREFWQRLTKTNKVNVDESERLASLVGGGILALQGLTRRFPANIGSMFAGGYLVYRGLTGHCPAYEAIGHSTASRPEQLQFRTGSQPKYNPIPSPQKEFKEDQEARERTINPNSPTDQAALESFPASDPPAQSPVSQRE